MALILLIETSTTVCSVALSRDESILSSKEIDAGYTHAENITVFINEISNEAGITLNDLDAVAVSNGPGSYTGLRIGASTAKGICYALQKPLIAIDTMTSLANCFRLQEKTSDVNFLIPMIDARRMEVYCAVLGNDLSVLRGVQAEVVSNFSFDQYLNEGVTAFFGDGASKCKPLFGQHKNARFSDIKLSASGMAKLALEKFHRKDFEDVALYEPFYLKEAAIGPKSL